jgi:hypothetical protein
LQSSLAGQRREVDFILFLTSLQQLSLAIPLPGETGVLATLELRELITVTGSGGLGVCFHQTEEAKVLKLICFPAAASAVLLRRCCPQQCLLAGVGANENGARRRQKMVTS